MRGFWSRGRFDGSDRLYRGRAKLYTLADAARPGGGARQGEAMTQLLLANLLHSAVALTWVIGVRRLAGPLSPTLWADLLRFCLGLPPMLAALQLLGLPGPPPWLHTLRVGRWTEAILATSLPLQLMLGALLAGTAVLFVVQEARPAWRLRSGRARAAAQQDQQLSAETEILLQRLRNLGLAPSRGRPPQVRILQTDSLSAGLVGIVEPTVVASRGLLAALDPQEREATLAHELAHWVRGGNLRVLGVWLLRALQAVNPAALILFRTLLEAEEAACDEVAVRVTGRPGALASALLKTHGHAETAGDPGAVRRAQAEIVRRGQLASTRARVTRLLDSGPQSHPSPLVLAASVAGLAALLWSIR